MSDAQKAIVGLKHELKALRERARELKQQNDRWRNVACTLRKMAVVGEEQYWNLLSAESLPVE